MYSVVFSGFLTIIMGIGIIIVSIPCWL